MSKQALKRIRRILGLQVNREPLPSFAWPGGYPVFYLCHDGESMCPDCVNREIDLVDSDTRETVADRRFRGSWALAAVDVNYECQDMFCANCSKQIPPAYGTD